MAPMNRPTTSSKKFITFCVCLCFFTVGVCSALLGPSLPTLANNLDTNVSNLAGIIPVRSVGYLLGSISGGLLFEQVNVFMYHAAAMLLCSIGLFLTPFAPTVLLLGVVMGIGSLTLGLLDVGGNVLILKLWGDRSAPYLQALHFAYAVGATVAPLIAEPFLSNIEESQLSCDNVIQTNSSLNISKVTLENTSNYDAIEEPDFPYFAWVYFISGGLCFVVTLLFVALTALEGSAKTLSQQKNTIKEEGTKLRVQIMTLVFLFFLIYVGMEVTYGVYIFTFSSIYFCHDKEAASTLNAVFWGSFSLGRLLSIFGANLVSATSLFRLDLSGSLVFSAFLCAIIYWHLNETLFWIATIGFGLFTASIFPSGLAWAEQYITINGKMASALVIGGSLGEILIPLSVGVFIEHNPSVFVYVVCGCMITACILYVFMQIIASANGKRRNLATISIDSTTQPMSKPEHSHMLIDKR